MKDQTVSQPQALKEPLQDDPKLPFPKGTVVKICSDRYGSHMMCRLGAVEGLKWNLVQIRTESCSLVEAHADALSVLADLKQYLPWKGLRKLTHAVRQDWLVNAAFHKLEAAGEDSFKSFVEYLKGENPVELSSFHLRFWSNYLRWGLEVDRAACSMVD